MSAPEAARCIRVIPTLAVGDVAAAVAWYRDALGFDEAWAWGDPPQHAAVRYDEVEVHLSATTPDPGGSWLYFVVTDVDALHARFAKRDVEIVHGPVDQEWDMREVAVRDLVGNELTFATAKMSRHPPLLIEREALQVRLEKRLTAVVRDIAEMKGMTVGEMLEETLLHTFEPWNGSVASPHTSADLERIAELKRKHGIDYDVHASYRFVEEGPAGS